MKTTKFIFATTTALVSSVTAALADNNSAVLEQLGDNHTAFISQELGSNNSAGSTGNPILQRSQFTPKGNTLSITQSGDNNEVGMGTILNRGAGFFQFNQSGPGNVATVSQSSNSNSINTINQVNRTAGASENSLVVTQQSGDGNKIGAISQDRSGSVDGTAAGRFGHEANIVQSGTGNSIGLARQGTQYDASADNSMDISQTGARNIIGSAIQAGTSNSMKAVFIGNENGDDGIANSFGSGVQTFADDVGVAQGDLTQNGSENFIDVLVTGDRTYFGIAQTGDRNRIDPVTITGTRNELAILQQGVDNSTSISDIATFGNNIGIRQFQDRNSASVMVAASGGGNKFGILQDGNDNDASVDIDGSGNGISAPLFNSLSGPAGSVELIVGWERGVVKQLGDLNTASLLVSGSGNEFGTLQDGTGNMLSGSQTGSNNVLAVAQLGSSNTSNTTQSGSGNNAGIMQ